MAWQTGRYSPEHGTYTYDVGRLMDACGLNVEQSTGNTIEDLEQCLNNGGGAVVSVDADEIWYGEKDDGVSRRLRTRHGGQSCDSGDRHRLQPARTHGYFKRFRNTGRLWNDGIAWMFFFVDAWEDSGCFMAEAYM